MENKDQKSKRISLKDIPPLDPSTIPLNSSLKPRRMMMVPEGMIQGGSNKQSAKSVLNDLCAAKYWKYPVYECCNVEGPCHMRSFTIKVVVEIKESLGTFVLECFGDPKPTKKAAAEHAAEGAIWYLKNATRNPKKPESLT